jgi:hypothetical protein
MKPSWMLRAVAALSIAMILTGCTSGARQAQVDAGARAGMATAGVTLDRQPDECGWAWADILARPGDEAQSMLKRYIEYVRGPINSRVARCYRFNENQRAGLVR